jgi:hypothetical protein
MLKTNGPLHRARRIKYVFLASEPLEKRQFRNWEELFPGSSEISLAETNEPDQYPEDSKKKTKSSSKGDSGSPGSGKAEP